MSAPSPLLSMEGVTAFYGKVQALRNVDLVIHQGEIVTLIGANGAGKSTLMMTLCGAPKCRDGSINFKGHALQTMPTHEIMRLGIAQSPEGRRIFPRMSVLENLQMGALLADPQHYEKDLADIFSMFPVLQSRSTQHGGTLSGGEQQMLAIARALMGRPALPLAG